MKCESCGHEARVAFKFCPECGAPAPQQEGIRVGQDVGAVRGGTLTGAAVAGDLAGAPRLGVDQKVETVEEGGAVVGAVIGDGKGPIHVGGEQQYGDRVQGDKRVIDTGGGAYVEGGVQTGGGAFVGRDQVVQGDRVQGDKVGGDKVAGDKVAGDKITIGDVSGEAVLAVGRGGQATRSEGVDAAALAEAFAAVYDKIQARPPDPDVDADEMAETVQQIEQEAAKGEEARPNRVERWLKNLAMMAPDICEVTAACLANPALGVATVIRKVAEKAQAEAGAG